MQAGGHDSLREMLYESLRGKPSPVFAFGNGIIPGASVWTGARMWCKQFREMGLTAGDRVLLCVEPSPAFVMVLVACLWEGLSLVVLDPTADLLFTMRQLDARVAVVDAEVLRRFPNINHAPGVLVPQPAGEPREQCVTLAANNRFSATPDIRLWLRSAGTSNTPTWWGVSTDNLLSVLLSHRPHLDIEGQSVLSVLPWHRADGLLRDLLPAIFGECMIVRDPRGGHDIELLIDLAIHWDSSYCSMDPQLVRRLAKSDDGKTLLGALFGGVVGGDAGGSGAVSSEMAEILQNTRLRSGYGHTESSGGVCLGETGEWQAGYLGFPVGCEANLAVDGVIHVRGPNLCAAKWSPSGSQSLDADRTFNTGDLAVRGPKGLIWVGRGDRSITLVGGQVLQTTEIETALCVAIGGISDALVCSMDGQTISVLLVTSGSHPNSAVNQACMANTVAAVMRSFYAVTDPHQTGIVITAGGEIARISNGAIDRTAALTLLVQRRTAATAAARTAA